jgi:hypothetical protein
MPRSSSSSAASKLRLARFETSSLLSWVPEVLAIGALVGLIALVVSAIA